MGEGTTLHPSFRSSLRVEIGDGCLSGFGGVSLLREFERRSGLLRPLLASLEDSRATERCAHRLGDLLRFTLYSRVLGFPDVADADQLRFDPVLRSVLAPAAQDSLASPLASKSTMHRFLTSTLALRENRRALVEGVLRAGLRPLLARGALPRRVYVDLDGTKIEVHGEQEGSRNNGYFRAFCYHPLVLSLGDFGTTLGFLLRPGNVHTAKHATLFLLPLLVRMRAILGARVEIVLRADSGFSDPVLLDALERHGFFFVVRLRENARLLRKAERIARRSPGRPSRRRSEFRCVSFRYRAESWASKRRVIARAEFEPDRLFADWTLLVAHLPRRERRRRVVRAYLRRGKSEQVHDVFKNELRGDLMSHHRMRSNQTRGLLTALAQNLLVAFDDAVRGRRRRRRPATIRAKVLLVATTLIRHARSLVLRLAPSGRARRLLERVARAVSRQEPAPASG
jgi:hypothetical protein